jgi:transcriptional regulator with XRE-family HTH domain
MKSNIIGEKIFTLCMEKNINFDELSERTGLSVEQIETIVNTEVLPSLAPLIKIARALGVRLGTFLDDYEMLGPIIHRQSDLHEPVNFSSQFSTSSSHLDFFSLAGNKAGRHMEPFLIDIKPSFDQKSVLSSHEGEEFIYVLQGSVKIIYGKETNVLNEGDSIYYDSIVDHLVCAADNQQAKILAVIYTPV